MYSKTKFLPHTLHGEKSELLAGGAGSQTRNGWESECLWASVTFSWLARLQNHSTLCGLWLPWWPWQAVLVSGTVDQGMIKKGKSNPCFLGILLVLPFIWLQHKQLFDCMLERLHYLISWVLIELGTFTECITISNQIFFFFSFHRHKRKNTSSNHRIKLCECLLII